MNLLVKLTIIWLWWSLSVNSVFGKGCDSEWITLTNGVNITWPKTYGKFF